MTEYFVRYTTNPEDDLKRGYSFDGYAMYSTPEEVAEELGIENYEVADYGDNPQYYKARNVTAIAPADAEGTLYGVMLYGLCGFGPFDTIEEAREADVDSLYDGIEGGGVKKVIFAGDEIGDWRVFEKGSTTFKPEAIVEVIE